LAADKVEITVTMRMLRGSDDAELTKAHQMHTFSMADSVLDVAAQIYGFVERMLHDLMLAAYKK